MAWTRSVGIFRWLTRRRLFRSVSKGRSRKPAAWKAVGRAAPAGRQRHGNPFGAPRVVQRLAADRRTRGRDRCFPLNRRHKDRCKRCSLVRTDPRATDLLAQTTTGNRFGRYVLALECGPPGPVLSSCAVVERAALFAQG